MQLYHSKKPTVHYLLPDDFPFEEGDFAIYSIKSEQKMVKKEDVLPYKIGSGEAFKILSAELKEQVGAFVEGVKDVASKVSGTQGEDSKGGKESDEKLGDKISGGLEFLSLTTKAMTLFWKISKTDDEEELLQYREQMTELRDTFQQKGYEPNANFVEVPFDLKKKYEEEGRLEGFREAAKEFEEVVKGFSRKKSGDSKNTGKD